MAKKPREHQRSSYQIKKAVVRCLQVANGETFTAVWITRRFLQKYQQTVKARLVKILCPGGLSSAARLFNKSNPDVDLLQEIQKSEPGAAESTVFLRQIEGKDVLIEYAQQPNGDLVKDQMGYILVMAFTRNAFGGKKTNLGLELVRRGLASTYKAKGENDLNYWSSPTYERQFDEAYKDALAHRRGPIHHNAPRAKTPPGAPRATLASYMAVGFVFGVIVGFLLCAFLMNIGR